jgi:hypothetical protein
MDSYVSSTKNIYFELLKFFDKSSHLHNICVFVKFHENMIFFVVYVKRENLSCDKSLFLAPNFVFFTHATRQLVFSRNDFASA